LNTWNNKILNTIYFIIIENYIKNTLYYKIYTMEKKLNANKNSNELYEIKNDCPISTTTPPTPNKLSTTSLSSLMEKYGATYNWIYYTRVWNEEKNKYDKTKICGKNHNWTKEECHEKANIASEGGTKDIYCVMNYDIKNTPLAIFDDDKKGRTIEETIEEYPIFKDCYYDDGNTKGYHFIVENEEFINATKVLNEEMERDFITDFIWFKSNKIYGNTILKMDVEDVKQYFPTFKSSKDQVKNIIKMKTNTDCVEVIDKKMKNEFLEELLNNINIKYCDNFQSWFDIVGSLKSINEIEYIDYFSKKSDKYKSGDYNNIVSSIKGTNYSIGTIYYYSKISDSKNHFSILDKFNKIPIKPYDDLGDSDYAEIFITISDDVFYHSTRECYFGYNSVKCIWEEKKKEYMLSITCDKLLDYFHKELRKLYYKMSNLEVCTNMEKNCSCKICNSKENYQKKIKQMEKNIKFCKSASNTKHIIDYIFDKLLNSGKDILMDSNPYLFCWNNKTYDIKNKKFVDRGKYDYITHTTGYDYEEPTTDYTDEIDTLFRNMFDNQEVFKSFFSVCKSGLTGVLQEKFTLANGSGGNGKGVVNGKAMALLLGNYYHDISHSILTKEITDDKPLPAIAKLNGKRYCVISEIKEDSLLLEDSIKKLTNPIINARGHYSSNTRIINTSTYVAECNARPKIQGENGDAMSRRYIDIYFSKRYTTDADKLKLKGYLPADTQYKEDTYWIPRRIAFFFWLVKEFDDTIYEPLVVKERSKDFLKECNIPLVVFDDKIEKCEFDNTKNTLITCSQFLDVIRRSEEFKYLEKPEKKLYTKNKIIEFFKNQCFDDYKDRIKLQESNSTIRSCIIGYRLKVEDIEE